MQELTQAAQPEQQAITFTIGPMSDCAPVDQQVPQGPSWLQIANGRIDSCQKHWCNL